MSTNEQHFDVVEPWRLHALASRLRGRNAEADGQVEGDGGGRRPDVRDPESSVVDASDRFGRGRTGLGSPDSAA